MKIVTLSIEEFDNFATNHKYNTYYQTASYGEFRRKIDGFDIHYLGFYDDGGSLVGAGMMLYKELFWHYKYAYAPRGLLLDYDNNELVDRVTTELRKLLKKQKFIFVKIDPPVVASERDSEGNIVNFNNNVNAILANFKENDYVHLGFNLYDESLLPRWNVFANLNSDARIIFNSFSQKVKEKINYGVNMAITVREDETVDINKFYEYIRRSNIRKSKKYFDTLKDFFINQKKIKIFYAYLDTNKYAINANELYNKEEEKNRALATIIQSGDSVKYNISKAVNDKITSDKLLSNYKRDVVTSAKFLKAYPDGITCGCSLCILDEKGANVLINFEDSSYNKYYVNAVLTYEMMKYFGKMGLSYINLGSITGNFNANSKFYSALLNKVGFNSTILEYIGEFDIIISPLMYKIYKRKYKKK